MSRNKVTARLVQFLSIAVFLGMAFWTAQKTGVLSRIGLEDVYWERARFLLGQGGATLYDGSSICSIGYSLLLVPICAFIKSPYAAYKIAILLNGIFVCGSYIVAVLTAKKLFTKESESFLSVACFFAVFCPTFIVSWIYTGPEAIVQFLFWCSFYLLVVFSEFERIKDLILLVITMILMMLMQYEMLGVVVALTGLLWEVMRRQKISESLVLKCFLGILLGIVVGDALERSILYLFTKETEITIDSSLVVFFDCLKTGWKNGYLFELLKDLLGKVYIVLLGSFLLICPVFRRFFETGINIREKKNTDFFWQGGIVSVFLIQLLFITIYDNAKHVNTGYFSLTGLIAILSPMILFGIILVKDSKKWIDEIVGSLVVFCVCGFFSASVYQENNVWEVAELNCGIFKIFQDITSGTVSAVYLSIAIILLLYIFILVCFKWEGKRKYVNELLRFIGIICSFVLFLGLNIQMINDTAVEAAENELRDISPIASVIAELATLEQCIYFNGSGNDNEIVVMQSLIPDIAIEQIESTKERRIEAFKEKITENTIILTGAEDDSLDKMLEEGLSDFKILYMTHSYSLWAKINSEVYSELEKKIGDRAEEVKNPNVKSKEVIYENKLYLAPGTYRMEIYFETTGVIEDQEGKITISDENGTIITRDFDGQMITEETNGAMVVIFSNREAMRDVKIKIKGKILSNISVKHVYYRKITSAYAVGYSSLNMVKSACTTIRTAEENCDLMGSVAYVDDVVMREEDISLDFFADYLQGYTIDVVPKDKLEELDSDYLIGGTTTHSYYAAMEQYAIIARNQRYTVLVNKNSVQYKYYLENDKILSDGKRINIQAFISDDTDAEELSLEMGSYKYECQVILEGELGISTAYEDAGVITIQTEDEILAQYSLTYNEVEDLISSNEICLSIPIYLNTKKTGIYCTVESDVLMNVSVKPRGVVLTSEKYQYAGEEEEIIDIVKYVEQIVQQGKSNDEVLLMVVQSTKEKENNQMEFSELQERLPNCNVDNIDYDEANALSEDSMLLTYGLSRSYSALLGKYSVLAHMGKYTLWARNDGQLLQWAIQSGMTVLNSGKKLSWDSVASMQGESNEAVINLPKGTYNITIEIAATELEKEDTVEVMLLRKKTEEEMEAEEEELLESGYTRKQARRAIERQAVCGTGTYEGYSFEESGKKIVSIQATSKLKMEDLNIEAFSWRGCEVICKVIWIEIK